MGVQGLRALEVIILNRVAGNMLSSGQQNSSSCWLVLKPLPNCLKQSYQQQYLCTYEHMKMNICMLLVLNLLLCSQAINIVSG